MAGITFAEYSHREGRAPAIPINVEMDNTLPYIRCLSCGKVIAAQTTAFKQLLLEEMARTDKSREELDPSFIEQTFISLGLIRPCCRVNVVNPILLPTGKLVASEIDRIRATITSSYYPSEIPPGGLATRMRRTADMAELETGVEELELGTKRTHFVRRVEDLKQAHMEMRRNVGNYTDI